MKIFNLRDLKAYVNKLITPRRSSSYFVVEDQLHGDFRKHTGRRLNATINRLRKIKAKNVHISIKRRVFNYLKMIKYESVLGERRKIQEYQTEEYQKKIRVTVVGCRPTATARKSWEALVLRSKDERAVDGRL